MPNITTNHAITYTNTTHKYYLILAVNTTQIENENDVRKKQKKKVEEKKHLKKLKSKIKVKMLS